MHVFVNISHPAHVHFFKNAIALLAQRGHQVTIGARKKEFTLELLKAYRLPSVGLTEKRRGGAGLLLEMIEQQLGIYKIVKNKPIDLMLQIAGVFNAPVGRYCGIPTLAFSDTENDTWSNRVSFSLSTHVLSPTCFDHTTGGIWRNQIHYPGYHELAYLSPRHLTGSTKPKDKFLVRFVGWGAAHDIREKGLSDEQKVMIVEALSRYGTVHISSEAPLPESLYPYAYKMHPSSVHEFMRTCRLIVGESATMASEAACMGIPAIFISNTGRGYTTEQDKVYGLIKHYRLDQWDEIMNQLQSWLSRDLHLEWQERRRRMLNEKIDVTSWLVDFVENYPDSLDDARNGIFERYSLKCAE